MTTLVKICGIRTSEVALAAAEAGADMAGFNFVTTSARYITPLYARRVIDTVAGKIGIVGVFRNAPLNEVNELVNFLGLDYVQLHGDEDEAYCTAVSARVIKVIPLVSQFGVEHAAGAVSRYNGVYSLVDRAVQGEGATLSEERLIALCSLHPIIVAGGLTPETVRKLVLNVRPAGVDVAGGVETNGHTDPAKVMLFVREAKLL